MNHLFEWLVSLLNSFKFWVFIDADEYGVLLRFGKYNRTLEPGAHFIIPILDSVRVIRSSLQVTNLPNQSVQSKFGKTWALSGVIRWRVTDAQRAILHVWDIDAALQHFGLQIIAAAVGEYDGEEELTYAELNTAILDEAQKQTEEWGVEVENFTLSDYASHRVIRLLTSDMPKLGVPMV